MSERDADDADCWLPIIGLCITIPVWLWRRLTPKSASATAMTDLAE
jgi:hypothetical protein